ncbi:MAG: 50S ribosomal protein L32e [Candidatus Aenigmarchaeota archaeon]
MSELKKERKKAMKKKPEFKRHETCKRAKLKDSWRKARGKHSKVRQKHRGKRKMPSIGYRLPAKVRDLNRAGYREVLVSTLADIRKLDPKKEMALITSSVGRKKRLEIMKAAEDAGVGISNIRRI